jgi:hypothetical protein
VAVRLLPSDMTALRRYFERFITRLTVAALVVSSASIATAQSADSTEQSAAEPLNVVEQRLSERYDRLELLAARLAEMTGSTQPRRAELLRQLVATGRERDVSGQFDEIIAALGDESFSTAVDGQGRLQADLEKLLELLLQEDRDRQLDAERKRVMRYLQDLNRLIRLERGVKARTDGGDDAAELADDQRRAEEDAGELQKKIEDDEAAAKPREEAKPESSGDDGTEQGESPQDSDGGDESFESKPSEGSPSAESQDGEKPPGEQQSDEQESGEQQEGEPQSGEPQSGSPQSGQSGQSGQPSQSGQQPQSTPMERTAERLRRAQQRMQDAAKRLDEAQREGAADEQAQAIEELEQAKAELEKILRQLREEELERMLVLLEARFRKMLDEQVAVYEETQQLDASQANTPAHELEIAAGRLSRREKLIVREADRALVLLREDGTSIAFPEAIEQARDDMQQIAERLNRVKVDLLTQGMEEDVIAALEESLATLRQQLDQLRDQKAQQSGGGGGEPGEQPLVDQLAELRMIRALQIRVNRRTQQYGALITGEQAKEEELLDMLEELSLRQAKISEATGDLETGANK